MHELGYVQVSAPELMNIQSVSSFITENTVSIKLYSGIISMGYSIVCSSPDSIFM